MARENTTTGQLEELADSIGAIQVAIRQIAEQMKTNSVPVVRLHLATLTNSLIPHVQHWLEIAQVNANDDIRAFLRGVESRSTVQKRYNEKRTLSAARKTKTSNKKAPRRTKKAT